MNGNNGLNCVTCRGWSCMACVAARAHSACAHDCPDCSDLSMLGEEPWAATVPMLNRGRVSGAYLSKRAQRRQPDAAARRHDALQLVREGLHIHRRATRLLS